MVSLGMVLLGVVGLVVLPGMLPVVPVLVSAVAFGVLDEGVVPGDMLVDGEVVLSARESGFDTLLGGTACGTVCALSGVGPERPWLSDTP